MSVWRINGFDGDETPHFDVAFIEAETAEAAADHLATMLADEDHLPDTVWSPTDRTTWRIRPFDGEFVLGGGCR